MQHSLKRKAKGPSPETIAGDRMKAVAMYTPYGYRAKIGLIIPSTNVIMEPEFHRMAPTGISVHTARMLLLGSWSIESYERMHDDSIEAARHLATAEVDVIAFGCTSGSFTTSNEAIETKLEEASQTPVVATSTAVVEALHALGARKVAVATPYLEPTTRHGVQFLEKEGFQVVSSFGLRLGETQEERRGIGRIPPESLFRLVRHVNRDDADVVFVSCTDLATIDYIAEAETEIGKPIVTSNQATLWSCLRSMGINQRLEGHGRLLSTH